VAVLGKESVMKTFLGTLKDARLFLLYLSTSASSTLDPSLGITAQYIYQKSTTYHQHKFSEQNLRYSNPQTKKEKQFTHIF